jgi:hypothetical protein
MFITITSKVMSNIVSDGTTKKHIPSSGAILLADLIYYFHILIVLFIIITPFTNILSLLILHVTFSICLLLHWKANSNVCSLSLLESYLRGVERDSTFSHQFIAPIYDISSSEWCSISTIITIVLLFISLTKLVKIFNTGNFSAKWKACKEIYNRKYDDPIDKMIDLYKCFVFKLLI